MTGTGFRPAAAVLARGANPFTVVSPVRPQRRWLLDRTLRLGQVVPSVELARLEFIHYGHWSIAPGLPTGTSSAWQPLDRPLLVFASDFDGSDSDYIDVFAEQIAPRINFFMQHCADFPGAWPGARLEEYLSVGRPSVLAYYRAYPHTTRDIVGAQAVGAALDRLRATATTATASRFAEAYAALRTDTQPASGRALRWSRMGWTDPRRWCQEAVDHQRVARASVHPTTWCLTTLSPVEDLDGLRTALGEVPSGDGPDAGFLGPATHFARFCLIDEVWSGRPGDGPVPLPVPYLLAVATFDVQRSPWSSRPTSGLADYDLSMSWVRDLAADPRWGGLIGRIWGHCRGFPAGPARTPAAVAAYLSRCRLPASLFIAGYGGTVGEVRDAVRRAGAFDDWALAHRSSPPVDLLADFLRNTP